MSFTHAHHRGGFTEGVSTGSAQHTAHRQCEPSLFLFHQPLGPPGPLLYEVPPFHLPHSTLGAVCHVARGGGEVIEAQLHRHPLRRNFIVILSDDQSWMGTAQRLIPGNPDAASASFRATVQTKVGKDE